MSTLQRKYIWVLERIRKAFPDAEVRDAENDFGWTYSVGVFIVAGQEKRRHAVRLEYVERVFDGPPEGSEAADSEGSEGGASRVSRIVSTFALRELSDKEREAWVEKMLDGFALALGVARADKPK